MTNVNTTTIGRIKTLPINTPLSSFATSLAIIFKNLEEFA